MKITGENEGYSTTSFQRWTELWEKEGPYFSHQR